MAVYHGIRVTDALFVLRASGGRLHPVALRTGGHRASVGIDWGCGGRGPLRLAVALLADALGPDAARRLHWQFCQRVTSQLPREGWALTRAAIAGHARAIDRVGRELLRASSPIMDEHQVTYRALARAELDEALKQVPNAEPGCE